VLSLYHGRLSTLGILVERDYDPAMDLFCFAGEVRQVVANLVGNALDASQEADGWWCGRGARATGESRGETASGSPWPTPEAAWSGGPRAHF